MVDVAQLVEHQIVALRVVGSSPTIHPSFYGRLITMQFASKTGLQFSLIYNVITLFSLSILAYFGIMNFMTKIFFSLAVAGIIHHVIINYLLPSKYSYSSDAIFIMSYSIVTYATLKLFALLA